MFKTGMELGLHLSITTFTELCICRTTQDATVLLALLSSMSEPFSLVIF